MKAKIVKTKTGYVIKVKNFLWWQEVGLGEGMKKLSFATHSEAIDYIYKNRTIRCSSRYTGITVIPLELTEGK